MQLNQIERNGNGTNFFDRITKSRKKWNGKN